MSTVILLDAGLIGLACVAPRKPDALAFRTWLAEVIGPSVFIRMAEVTQY